MDLYTDRPLGVGPGSADDGLFAYSEEEHDRGGLSTRGFLAELAKRRRPGTQPERPYGQWLIEAMQAQPGWVRMSDLLAAAYRNHYDAIHANPAWLEEWRLMRQIPLGELFQAWLRGHPRFWAIKPGWDKPEWDQ